MSELSSPRAQLTTPAGGLAASASAQGPPQQQHKQQQQELRGSRAADEGGGGDGEGNDGVVNVVTGLSLGEAVRLKQVRETKSGCYQYLETFWGLASNPMKRYRQNVNGC